MQRYFYSLVFPCSIHKDKKVGFICTKDKCKDRLICSKCAKTHDITHDPQVISIAELLAIDFEVECKEAEKLVNEHSDQRIKAKSELEKNINELKNDVINFIEELRKEIKEKNKIQENTEQAIQSIELSKKKLNEFTGKVLETDEEKNNFCKEFVKFSIEKRKFLAKEPSPIYIFDSNQKTEAKIQKIFLPFIKKGDFEDGQTFWTWNTEKKSPQLVIEDQFKVSLPKGNSGNHGIIGEITFTKGIYEWNLYHDPKIDEDDWGIGAGIIEVSKAEEITNWKDFPFKKSICRASLGNSHNITSIEKTDHRGKLTKYRLDYFAEEFQIILEGKLVAKVSIEKDKSYYPFLDFNSSDIYATLSFD